MNKKHCWIIIAVFLTLFVSTPGHCTVDWTPGMILKVDKQPLDTAITPDGKWTFVLTKGGKICIYDYAGNLNDTIPVTPDVDQIAVTGSGEKLIVSSKTTQIVRQIDITFVANFKVNGAPILGSPDSPVEIVLFSDFQCPYCARIGALLEYAMEQNPETVHVVFKQFPLPFHEFARQAAIASLAAQNQGKFWELHDLLFQSGHELNDKKIEDLAKEAGLDMKRFKADIKDDLLNERVEMDIMEGKINGVRGTPSLFVNGRPLKERSPQDLQLLIDKELARTKNDSK
ncbi:MAG: thioredoxin domain-containing protein [Desulfobulbaceae bacterium]|nr:thioredoxin domain-containing protein [Desulfobulbaceae bacterium]